jgi:NAD(P)-dependent dehydrogenase (short-subunit alcohol dehydrogenase family)
MKRLENKVAIITGASLGLGKAAALLFAKEGASVVICDRGRTPENAEKVLKEAEGLSGEIAYKKCDVLIKDDIVALVKFTLERYGKVDVMVNNAIVDTKMGMLEDIELDDWEDTIFCHMTAPLIFCQEVVPTMIKQGSGSIINVSSHMALVGSSNISSYGPAKAGMINFTKSIAVTYGPFGIRANSLTPARMLTEKKHEMLRNSPSSIRIQKFAYPTGSPAQPEQVADAMLFLASDESAAITGHNLITDRGLTAQCPSVPVGRGEANLKKELAAQGSEWLKSEL